MASTIAELAAGQAIMTDKCVDEFVEGQFAAAGIAAAGRYKLVLLNLSLGAATLTAAGTDFWDDLTACEIATAGGYTKGTGITLTGANIAAITRGKAVDFAPISLDNQEWNADAYAIVRATGTLSTSPVLGLGKFDVMKSPAGTGVGNFTIPTLVNPIKFTAGAAA